MLDGLEKAKMRTDLTVDWEATGPTVAIICVGKRSGQSDGSSING